MISNITNESLKSLYEKAFEDRDAFFTYSTDDCRQIIVDSRDWAGFRVLEIGCGEGDTAEQLAQKGAIVTAIDYAQSAIQCAKEKHANSNVTFLYGNWEDMVEGTYDAVVMQEVIEHINDPLEIMGKIHDILNERGELLITCPAFLNPRGYIWMTLQIIFDVPMSLSDIHIITPHEMEKWCEVSGFDIIEWKTFRFSQAWGPGMTNDMTKRLTNALRDAQLDNSKVNELLEWMELATRYEKPSIHNGAKNYFRLRKN